MVMGEIASKKFNWPRDIPMVIEGDARIFMPDYNVSEEARPTVKWKNISFADLPSAGIWENRTESDDELLLEFGSRWRTFASEK